jgi:hypothetical protein
MPAGDADAPMPAVTDADAPPADEAGADAGAARIDDAVTQHSGTPNDRPDDDRDLPPLPTGHRTDEKT